MPSHEDLYREMTEQEEADDYRYRQQLARTLAARATRREPDSRTAQERYDREIAPVIATRARIAAGQPPTNNPIHNAWLRLTGRDKLPPPEKIIDPSKGFTLEGPSIAEVQQEIAANPQKFRHLARQAPRVKPVEAKRRELEDLHRD